MFGHYEIGRVFVSTFCEHVFVVKMIRLYVKLLLSSYSLTIYCYSHEVI